MIKDNLRVALYARVSGEQQEKEDTIASQLEALTQRIATDGSECEPELHFVDDGCSGYILARIGVGAAFGRSQSQGSGTYSQHCWGRE